MFPQQAFRTTESDEPIDIHADFRRPTIKTF